MRLVMASRPPYGRPPGSPIGAPCQPIPRRLRLSGAGSVCGAVAATTANTPGAETGHGAELAPSPARSGPPGTVGLRSHASVDAQGRGRPSAVTSLDRSDRAPERLLAQLP